MYQAMRIKYFGADFSYRHYLELQAAIVIALLLLSAVFYNFGSESSLWYLRNAWWICIVTAVLEIIETKIAIARAKAKLRESTFGREA